VYPLKAGCNVFNAGYNEQVFSPSNPEKKLRRSVLTFSIKAQKQLNSNTLQFRKMTSLSLVFGSVMSIFRNCSAFFSKTTRWICTKFLFRA